MAKKGSCIIAEDFKERLSPLHASPFLDRVLFIMLLSFFAPLISMQNISQPLVAMRLPVNPKKQMAFISWIRLRPLQVGDLVG